MGRQRRASVMFEFRPQLSRGGGGRPADRAPRRAGCRGRRCRRGAGRRPPGGRRPRDARAGHRALDRLGPAAGPASSASATAGRTSTSARSPTAARRGCSPPARRRAWCSARLDATSTATGWRPRGSRRAWRPGCASGRWRMSEYDTVFALPAVDEDPDTELGVLLMGLGPERLLAGLGVAASGDDPAPAFLLRGPAAPRRPAGPDDGGCGRAGAARWRAARARGSRRPTRSRRALGRAAPAVGVRADGGRQRRIALRARPNACTWRRAGCAAPRSTKTAEERPWRT